MNEEDRFKLYQRLLKSAAKQLGCKPSDDRAKDLACMRLMRESVTLKLLAGKDCNPSDLRWLIEELAKVTPPPDIPPVQLEIVDNDGNAMPLAELVELRQARGADPAPSASSPTNCPDVGFVDFTPQPSAPAIEAAPVAMAKPIHPNDLPRRNPGSIHDAVLNGVPARMTGASYGFCAGNSGGGIAGPFFVRNEPRPNFEATHNLPSVPQRRSSGGGDPGGHGGSVCW